MIAPPVEVLVTVVIALPTVTLCSEDERVKAGGATVTVKVNVCVALPEALVAVTV